jgi:hypothetical protein
MLGTELHPIRIHYMADDGAEHLTNSFWGGCRLTFNGSSHQQERHEEWPPAMSAHQLHNQHLRMMPVDPQPTLHDLYKRQILDHLSLQPASWFMQQAVTTGPYLAPLAF